MTSSLISFAAIALQARPMNARFIAASAMKKAGRDTMTTHLYAAQGRGRFITLYSRLAR